MQSHFKTKKGSTLFGPKRSYSRGFTLIEILVVLGIMSVILSIGLFGSFNSYKRYVFYEETETLMSILYRVRSNALNNVGGVSHGLRIEDESFIIFEGRSFNPHALSNHKIKKSEFIQFTGMREVTFEALSGNPNQTGVITASFGAETKDIVIENEGKISL